VTTNAIAVIVALVVAGNATATHANTPNKMMAGLSGLMDIFDSAKDYFQGDSGIEQILEDKLKIKASDLDYFADQTRLIESEGGETNTEGSSARGGYQFLTKDNIDLETGEVKLNKKGEPTLSSYNVALNRIEDMYEKNDTNAPEWIQEARENQNPLDLTDRQEKDLFLANLYNRDAGGETDKLLKKIADGDKDAMMKLYMKYHHTNEDDKITRKRASEFYYNN
tara:strand:- start:37 stop:708 length:672 start_codon:yes stop_codon:yes gene_type:complete